MSEDKFGLRPLWDALLEIYDEFSRICEKHGLMYYVFAGTALGAVRHKGFIPWDDDLDVIMPRPDYEKFMTIAAEELPEYLKFVNWRNTPELDLLAGKIQDTRKAYVLSLEQKLGFVLSNGLFIDVYPIDGYPRGMKYWLTRGKVLALDAMWRYAVSKSPCCSFAGRTKWLVGCFLCLFNRKYRSKAFLMAQYESILFDTPFQTSDRVGDIGYTKSIFLHPSLPKTIWGTPKFYEFEGRMIPLPNNVDAHLRNNYGEDYMTPPPLEKQKPTHSSNEHFSWWIGPTND